MLVERGGVKARIIGFPDTNKWTENKFDIIEPYNQGFQIALVHTFASSKTKEFFGNRVYQYKDLAKYPVDIWVFGHWHFDQGIESIVDDAGDTKVFVNVGAISRGAYSYENIDRIPSVGFVEFGYDDSGKKIINKIEQIRLKVKPAKEVFDVNAYEQLKKKKTEMSNFVRQLGLIQSTMEATTSDDYFKNLELENEVLTEIENYILRAQE
jgi:hypothetical protein